MTPNVRLERPLGRGGMGSVWLAHHLGLDDEVAVKLIRPEALLDEPHLSERFVREANIAAKMRSPHTVQVFDHGETDDGTPYIVMERLKGESLADRLASRGLDEDEVVMLVEQLGQVLALAHRRNIVHRDLKPENVFLIDSDYDLFVKVLDFGIATQTIPNARRVTTTGAMIGTPSYMSPEQIESSKEVGPHADLWALSVMVYEVLVGELPFRGETSGALCIAIDKARFTPPSEVRPTLARFDAWFARALARDIDDRFASADELVSAFVDAAEGREAEGGTDDVASASRDAEPSASIRSGGPSAGSSEGARDVTTAGAVPRTGGYFAWVGVGLGLLGLVAFALTRGDRVPMWLRAGARAPRPAIAVAPAETAESAPTAEPAPTAGDAPGDAVPAHVGSRRAPATPAPPSKGAASAAPQPTGPRGAHCMYVEGGRMKLRTDLPECLETRGAP